MTKDEALRMALDALECHADLGLIAGKTIAAIREVLAQPAQEPVNKYCCHTCFNKSGQVFLDRMILCPECGNKRCPRATHHDLPCTNSNEPGQAGSIYTTPQPAVPERKPLTDEQRMEMWRTTKFRGNGGQIDWFIEGTRAAEAAHGITGESK